MNHRATRPSGFTLIETMIVASLIGMLAAIAVPNFIRSRTSAHTSVCINNLRAIDYAIQQWALEEKKGSKTTVQFADISSYLKSSVLCPAGGTSFADSYSITVVGSQPLCQRVPADHLLPQAGLEVVTPSPAPPGNGNGNGNNGHHGHGP